MKQLVSRSEFNKVIDHPGSAIVLGLNEHEEVLLIEKEREGVPYKVYEIPGGVLELNETPEQAARRELEEETGYTFDLAAFDRLIAPSVGYSNEWISVFTASVKKGSHLAEYEPLFFSKASVRQLIEKIRILDAQSLAVLSVWLFENRSFQPRKPDVLFLCTGNYYRSRFCEMYFNYLSQDTIFSAASYGLWAYRKINPGFISEHTVNFLNSHKIPINYTRSPEQVEERHLKNAQKVIALDEVEHRPMMDDLFPEWANRIEYWNVHDIDFTRPEIALESLRVSVEWLARGFL